MSSEIEAAVALLRAGQLVAFPTETVYGLGADAGNEEAVRRIYAVKGRPADHPVIVHVADGAPLADWSVKPSAAALALAAGCWPGPLTLLVHRPAHISLAVTGGRETVGLRVPAHPMALDLLRSFGGAVAAPSANRFGRVSPTTAQHVRDDLGADVSLVLDGGPCRVGVESTIVDTTGDRLMILRIGGVPAEVIEHIVGSPVVLATGEAPRASGMLASHYAPKAHIELIEHRNRARLRVDELRASGRAAELLDPAVSAQQWAHDLYAWLRDADHRH
ncbi:MAG: tRNA threonylcarbamoyl adenosine modification protein Sua5/YciO/YrdC/YwlC family, partial [Acidimicrobiia bacterium]|nr:tRNA threonylcarbamoyl adenosine modification protein Sua5/YciO/YrdC/YwlC family [Acidimicrobiia bacterium]